MKYHFLESRIKTKSKPPVIFMIHGYGSNKEDLFSFANELPKEYCIISLQAPMNLPWGGYAWYHIDFSNGEKFTDVPQARKSRDLIATFIDEAIEKYQLDADNVTLLGFSQGAILSYGIIFKYPEKIKNVIALSGYILPEFVKNKPQEEYKKINIFASHGLDDTVIPIELANKIPSVLTTKEIKHNYKAYKMEHSINSECFSDMLNWIKNN